MYPTMVMDIRPQQSSPPAMPGSAATPSPAIAPAVNETLGTAPPSAGPGSPHDGSLGEDGANGHGVARRPGNLWTSEDREDMFNRRERGEGWETICADYPNRSRHAMQQQYSMMKKQKALADGTWASNRRGRKRRNPAPERPSAAVKRAAEHYSADMDDNMTEVDDNDEGPSEDPEDSDDAGGRGMSNGRPNALMRSATEPAKATKSRQSASYSHNGINTDSHGTPVIGQALDAMSDRVTGFTSVNRGRKRRMSMDHGSNSNLTPPLESQPGNIVLNTYDLLSLLQKGEDWARKNKRALEDEKNSQTLAFEQSVNRANRRATEAQEKLSYASFEHGEAIKKIRMECNETLKAKSREHKEATAKLKIEFDEHFSGQRSQIEAQNGQNEELRRQIEMLKRDLPDREREMDQEIMRLRAEKQALEEVKKTWEATAKAEVAALKTESATENVESQPTGPQPIDANPPRSYIEAEADVYRTCQEVYTDFRKSASMITKFHEEFEELGHKRTMQYLADIATQNHNTSSLMETFSQKFERLHGELARSKAAAEPRTAPQSHQPAAKSNIHSVISVLDHPLRSAGNGDFAEQSALQTALPIVKEEIAMVTSAPQPVASEQGRGDVPMLDNNVQS